MGTNGIVSVTQGQEVLFKIIAGSDGDRAKDLAKAIRKVKPKDLSCETLYKLALEEGFGDPMYDLVVMDQSREFHRFEAGNQLSPMYRETFYNPEFNPRWFEGFSSYVELVKLGKVKFNKISLRQTQLKWRKTQLAVELKQIGLTSGFTIHVSEVMKSVQVELEKGFNGQPYLDTPLLTDLLKLGLSRLGVSVGVWFLQFTLEPPRGG